MNTQLTVAFSIELLLTVTVVTSVDLLETADAIKSQGNPLPETGSKKVCGDKLCSEVESSEDKAKHGEDKAKHGEDKAKHGEDKAKHGEDKAKHGESSHEGKHKMKERHLQLLEQMKSMSKMEMIDFMKSMMSEHHDKKIEKMSQMDEPELLKHIEKMLDKMSKDDHSDMDDAHHEDELTKFQTAELLSEQHLKTFDELDFDVFTNQKWDRLHESHSSDIVVHWPDGRTTTGIEPHIEDLKAMFVWAPDTNRTTSYQDCIWTLDKCDWCN